MTHINHPLTRVDYFGESADSVRVVDGAKWGRFDRTGMWLEGELKQADPHMCRYVAGEILMRELMAQGVQHE
jgi:hypothetical protein